MKSIVFIRSTFLSAVIFLSACSTTHQAREVTRSGFLRDYSQLSEGEQALLVYKKPGVDWARYTKVMIDPVAVYTAKDADLKEASRQDQKALANYFAAKLREDFKKEFLVVSSPGADVLRLRVALTDADQSEVLLDTVTTIMPIGLALSTFKRGVEGSDSFVGFAQAEAEILDSNSNTRLLAAVDKRYGTKALRSKLEGSWGHAKEAIDYWSEHLTESLKEMGAGRWRKK